VSFEEGGPVHPCTYGNIHDGGPAFPTETVEYGSGNFKYGKKGMSLRDYFAGQAMISMVGHSISIAKEAYQVADAMLEARTLKPE
jgi:hypothetical protein